MSFNKRFSAVLLAVVLMFSLTACSGGGDNGGSDSGFEDGKTPAIDDSKFFTEQDKDDKLAEDATAVTLDGKSITLTRSGEFLVTGNIDGGQLIIDADKNDIIQLCLSGVSIKAKNTAAIYVKKAKQVIITLAEGSSNTLESIGTFQADADNNVDGVVFAKSDLTVNGKGSLTVSTDSGHGIVSKDNLKITGGTVKVTAARHGLSANDSLCISAGSLDLEAGTDGMNVENLEDTSLGFFYSSGGTFNVNCSSDAIDASSTLTVAGGDYKISAADDALHSDTDLVIAGGKLDISTCYEGLEGNSITVSGGEISLSSTDDGINAAGGNDESGFGGFGGGDRFGDSSDSAVTISGGSLFIDAGGDGIDSNGALTVSGGETYVSGPTNSGNSALDFGGEGKITGGIFVAAGSAGMAQNFSAAEQGTILVNLGNIAANEKVTLKKGNEELLSFTFQKPFASLVVSTPDIKKGETYTVSAGGSSVSIEMTELIYGSGGMGGPGGMGGGFGGHGGGPGGMGGPGGRPVKP